MGVIDNPWVFLVYIILPYVTIAVFVGGLIYRIRRWIIRPHAKAVIFPAASSTLGAVSRVAGDIFLFRKTFNGSKGLWAPAYLLHVSLALVIVGHFRTVTEFSWFWNLFGMGEATVEHTTFVLGIIAGIAILTGAFFLLVRRLSPKWRALSLFEDYLLLALLLAIIVTGDCMRLFSPVNLEEIRQYTTSVLTFRPAVTVSNPIFPWHFFLAQILIMYFPFSKLVHGISKPITDYWTVR